MSISKNNLFAIIAAILALVGYFFSFISASAIGYTESIVSGFDLAFSFTFFWSIIPFITFIVTIFTMLMMIFTKKGPWGIIFLVCAALQLLTIIFAPSFLEDIFLSYFYSDSVDVFYAYGGSINAGFGLWWSMIFFIIAGFLQLAGKKLNPPQVAPNNINSEEIQADPTVSQSETVPPVEATVEDQPADTPAVDNNIKYCSECGARIAADSKFCPKCGKQC